MPVLRIASVPASHPYVDHLDPVTSPRRFVRLDAPIVPHDPGGDWMPSAVLEPIWLRQHAHLFDLVHVHFGFEHRTATELGAFVGTLRALQRPLVVTVHDLVNPHLSDQRPHGRALDILVGAAAAVTTLTRGAADEIRRRWGRRATVLRHPHIVDLHRIGVAQPEGPEFVVGLHGKTRANVDSAAVEPELRRTLATLEGAVLHPGFRQRLSDAELWDHLARLDVLVLPYRFGTHSGFVEACHDVGTTVIASRVGFFAQQQRLFSYDLDVPGSLGLMVRTAYRDRPQWGAAATDRRSEREYLAGAHAELYERVLADTVSV